MKFLIPKEHKNASGIYIIRNSVNDKVYIGSAANFAKRFATHKCSLRHNKHHSPLLQRFANKYGLDTLLFEALEVLPFVPEELIRAEQRHIDALQAANRKAGFNIAPIAGRAVGTKGRKMSPETRERISRANAGRPKPPGAAAKRIETRLAAGGMGHTPESLEKMRLAGLQRRGAPQSTATRQGLELAVQKRHGEKGVGRKLGEMETSTCKVCATPFTHLWYKERLCCSMPCQRVWSSAVRKAKTAARKAAPVSA